MDHPLIGRTVQIVIADPWDYAEAIGVVLFGIVTGIASMNGDSQLIIRLKVTIDWHSKPVEEIVATTRQCAAFVDKVASGAVVHLRFAECLEMAEGADDADDRLAFVGAIRRL